VLYAVYTMASVLYMCTLWRLFEVRCCRNGGGTRFSRWQSCKKVRKKVKFKKVSVTKFVRKDQRLVLCFYFVQISVPNTFKHFVKKNVDISTRGGYPILYLFFDISKSPGQKMFLVIRILIFFC